MYKRRAKGWIKHLDFMILDVISMHIAMIIAFMVRHGWHAFVYRSESYRVLGMWMTVFSLLTAVLFSTLHNVLRRGYAKEMIQTIIHSMLVFGFSAIFLFTMKDGDAISRVTLWVHLGIYIILSYSTRMLYKRLMRKYVTKYGGKREILLICDEEIAEETIQNFRNHPEDMIHVRGLILFEQKNQVKTEETEETSESGDAASIASVPVVARIEDAANYICREWIEEVYIAVSRRSQVPEELLEQCGEMGVTVHLQLIQIKNSGMQKVERIADRNVLTASIAMATPTQLFLKRAMDILGGLVLSFFALLAMAIVSIPLKKASPGPILYKSERIGQNGKRFYMYKIRSMYPDAEDRKKEFMAQNRIADGRMFKLEFDPRIIGNEVYPDGTHKTGIGQKIRDWSIDELPQGFNILIGNMSLVGTRPPTPDEWEKYEYHHRARLAFKPGLTGMWQVSGRSQIRDFEEVVKLDTKYITNWSLGLDIKILFQTVIAVIMRKGAM